VLLAHPTIERLVLGMRVNVDQARQDKSILAVDYPIGRAAVIPPEKVIRSSAKATSMFRRYVWRPTARSHAMTQSASRITVMLTDCSSPFAAAAW